MTDEKHKKNQIMGDKKVDINTSIMDKKKAPNRLIVDEATNDDNSVVNLSRNKMDELQLFQGDNIFLKGKKGKETVCIVLVDENMEDANIRMNKVFVNSVRTQIVYNLEYLSGGQKKSQSSLGRCC